MKFLNFILLTLTLSCSAFAGQEGTVGNGGDIVYCPEEGFFTLDFYESIQNGKTPKYHGFSVPEKVKSALDRLAKRSPKLSEVIEYFAIPLAQDFDFFYRHGELNNFELNRNTRIAYFTDATEIREIDDSFHRFVPAHCKVRQIANSYAPRNLLEKRYYVNTQLLKKLDLDNLANLALHESIYTVFKAYYDQYNSVHVRGLNILISSPDIEYLSMYEYVNFLKIFEISKMEPAKDQNVIFPFNGVDVLIGKNHVYLQNLSLSDERNFEGYPYPGSQFKFADNHFPFYGDFSIEVKSGLIRNASVKEMAKPIEYLGVTLVSERPYYRKSVLQQLTEDKFSFSQFRVNSKQYNFYCDSFIAVKNNQIEFLQNSASSCKGSFNMNNQTFKFEDANIIFNKDLKISAVNGFGHGVLVSESLYASNLTLHPNGNAKLLYVKRYGSCDSNYQHDLFGNKVKIKACQDCKLSFDEQGKLLEKQCTGEKN